MTDRKHEPVTCVGTVPPCTVLGMTYSRRLGIILLTQEYQEEIFQPAYRASESEKEKMVKSYCRLYIPLRPRAHESGIYLPPLGPVTDMMIEWRPAERPEDNCRDGHPCSI